MQSELSKIDDFEGEEDETPEKPKAKRGRKPKPEEKKVNPKLEGKESVLILSVPRDWIGEPITESEKVFHERTIETISERYHVEPSTWFIAARCIVSVLWYAGKAVKGVSRIMRERKENKADASNGNGNVGLGENGKNVKGNPPPAA